jgi:pimeloyl-ACP methyl ester carboxylesterase
MASIIFASALLVLLSAVPAIVIPEAPPNPNARSILADAQKVVSDHGIDESEAVHIGGIKQWITVRGRDARNPILLFLHGGPGSPELPNRYMFEMPWTDYFTVVEWDQRGAGKTYALNDPAQIRTTMNGARLEADAEELVAYLRKAYGKKKIFVLGHSWGSILGLELAQRRPDWLYAYVGMGQVIETRAAEAIGYAGTLAAARQDHNSQAIETLTKLAPYPGPGDLSVEKVLIERRWSDYYGGLTHNRRSYGYWANAQELSPDYTDADRNAMSTGSAFSLGLLASAYGDADFTGLTHLACPVILFEGRFDLTTPSTLAHSWFDRLSAPSKQFVWFENSAHMIHAEEPGRVLVHLVQDARPFAERAGDIPTGEDAR